MKQILLTALVVFMFNHANAQDSEKLNLSKQNKELLNRLQLEEAQRLERVQVYLSVNPNVKATLVNDGIKLVHIHDIINNKPIYRSTDNLQAARATKTVHLWTGGSLGLDLGGAGMTVGVWDGGPADNNHVEFQNASGTESRVTIIDGAVVDGDTGFSSHGTHVSGTISANGTNVDAKGMASNVNIKSYNWSNDQSEMIGAANDFANPILVSNHSYGIPINQNGDSQLDASLIGTYTQGASSIDNIAKNNPKYLMVMSAGNNGTTNYPGGAYAGYDKLTDDKNSKNSLIIANANPAVTEQPLFSGNYEITNLVISSSSSQGPTDDLRIKPDIAADGSNLLSTVPDNGYATFSGTSMSAPNTTGTLVLLQQYYNQLNGTYMNSSTLRGLVCHTSIDDSVIGPDPKFGWGFLNAKVSAETIAGADNGEAVLDELSLENNGTYTYTFSASAGDKLIATLCWTDMPGSPASSGSVNDATPRLVNDLDLRLSSGGTTYLPWKLDFSSASGYSNSKADNNVDNLERIDIDVPASGVYTLTVTHKGTLQGNTGGPFDPQSQDFSLIVTGSNLVLSTEDNYLARSLSIFPNPSKGEFTISFESNLNNANSDVKVAVIDISGRVIHNKVFNNTSSIFREMLKLDNINPGVYIINISEGINVTSHKIIIE